MKLLLTSEFGNCLHKTKPYIEKNAGTKRLVFIPTISSGDEEPESYEQQLAPFRQMGFQCDVLELAGKTATEVEAVLKDTDVIFVGCGNTFFHLEHMQKCGFKDILMNRLREGALYIGFSAGSIIASPDIAFITPMDDPAAANAIGTEGLGLVDFYFVPHADHPIMGLDAQAIIDAHQPDDLPLFAMNDDQAIYVEDGVVRIL